MFRFDDSAYIKLGQIGFLMWARILRPRVVKVNKACPSCSAPFQTLGTVTGCRRSMPADPCDDRCGTELGSWVRSGCASFNEPRRSFDDEVGADEDRRRQFQTDLLGSPQIDGKFPLYRQIEG